MGPGETSRSTTDSWRVWFPIFDSVRVASVGAVAVAPSQSNIIYAGTGEQGRGNGVYKSTDFGATWTNVGLAETRYIDNLIVDPRNPDIVLVAASGDRQPGPERGVYRTTDGGKTWTKVLFRDIDTSAVDICFAPDNARVVFAATNARARSRRSFTSVSRISPSRAAVPERGTNSFARVSRRARTHWLFSTSFGPISTPDILGSDNVMARIGAAFPVEEPRDLRELARASGAFAEASCIVTPRVRTALTACDRADVPASMSMLGDGAFAVGPGSERILSQFGRVHRLHVAREGFRLLEAEP
jgi:hypothetical protein